MQQVLSVANRKKRAVKASTVNDSVLPNSLVSSASSVQMKDPIPSVEFRSSPRGNFETRI